MDVTSDPAGFVVATLSRALAYGTPLLWATVGEIAAERAGVINLGVEGMMALGAVVAFVVAQVSGVPALGVLAAAAVGGAAALVHAFVGVTLRANQYVSGLALSMLGLGLAGLVGRGWEGVPLKNPLPSCDVPILGEVPVLGPALFRGQNVLTYAALGAAVAAWFVLRHTRWGLTLRSVGESPAAADSAGVAVSRVRYLAVAAGGVMAGIAGAYLSVAYRPSWTEGMTAGMGWIAVALTIFAGWDALKAVGGALLFGALFSLSFRLQAWVAPELLKVMPYVSTILVLALTVPGRRARSGAAPEALGLAYVRGER